MTAVTLALWQPPPLSSAQWQALAQELPLAKQLHAKRYQSVSRWQSFVAGHHLLRVTLAHVGGSDETYRTTYGAEWESTREGGSCFSGGISHSRNFVACVVSQGGAAGVDVEAPSSRRRNFEELVEHFFSSQQRQSFSLVLPAEQESAFLSLWTLKESYLKAQGLGVSSQGLLTEFIAPLSIERERDAGWKSCNFYWRESVGAVTVASNLISKVDVYQMGEAGDDLVALASPIMGAWYCPVEAR